MLELANWDQRCYAPWFMAPLFCGLIFMSILKPVFYQTYLRCFCFLFTETVLVNISETIVGDRSIWFPFLTKRWFCRKLSMNITIDNRYRIRFVHLGKPILSVNHSGASLQSRPYFGCAHARVNVSLASGRSLDLRHESNRRYLMFLLFLQTNYVSSNCIYFQYHLLCPLKLNCNQLTLHKRPSFCQLRPPATIRHFFVAIAQWL